MTIVSGILSGILIAVVSVWFVYMHNRLWRSTVADQAAGALAGACDLGFTVTAARYGAKWLAAGSVQGVPIRIEWCGGPMGLRTVVRRAGVRWVSGLVRTQADLSEALDSASGQRDHLPGGAASGIAGSGVVPQPGEHVGEPVGDLLSGVDARDGQPGLGFLEEGLRIEE